MQHYDNISPRKRVTWDVTMIKINNKLAFQAHFCTLHISNMNCCLFFVSYCLDGQSLINLGIQKSENRHKNKD